MPRALQRLISVFAITAVLFTQLAVSAYACPMQFAAMENDAVAETTQPSTASAPPAAMDCDGMEMSAAMDMDTDVGMSHPALCQHHCKNEQQNVSDTPLDLAPITFASTRIVDWVEPLLSTSLLHAIHVSTPSLHHATSPPASIQHCCFRI